MATIGDMVPGTPTGANLVSGGDTQLRDIKSDTQGSFPFFGTTASNTGVCTKTGPELDDAPEKLVAETIDGQWTFSARIDAKGGITMDNNARLLGRNALDDADILLAFVNVSDECEYGDTGRAMNLIGTNINVPGTMSVTGLLTSAGGFSGTTIETTGTVEVGTELRVNNFLVGAVARPQIGRLPLFDGAGTQIGFIDVQDLDP